MLAAGEILTCFDHVIKASGNIDTNIHCIGVGNVEVIERKNFFACQVDGTASGTTATLTIVNSVC